MWEVKRTVLGSRTGKWLREPENKERSHGSCSPLLSLGLCLWGETERAGRSLNFSRTSLDIIFPGEVSLVLMCLIKYLFPELPSVGQCRCPRLWRGERVATLTWALPVTPRAPPDPLCLSCTLLSLPAIGLLTLLGSEPEPQPCSWKAACMPLRLSLGVGLQPRLGAGEGETGPQVCGPPFSSVSWQRWSLVAGGLDVTWMPVAVTLGSFQWRDLGCALWCQILWFLPVSRARFPRLPIHSVNYLNAFQ